MRTFEERIAGLRTIRVEADEARLSVIALHGYAMTPEDLSPFARSMGVPARFLFPEAPLGADPGGRAWWPIDQERRARQLEESGPRDLAAEHPAGTKAARALLHDIAAELRRRSPSEPLVIVGFSQGGMLACDAILRGKVDVAGLALLSSSRISADEWEPLAGRLQGLPVLVAHGTHDHDLAFAAGERLRDFCIAAGARVTWQPFDGGHEIPLVAWRALRRFLAGLR